MQKHQIPSLPWGWNHGASTREVKACRLEVQQGQGQAHKEARRGQWGDDRLMLGETLERARALSAGGCMWWSVYSCPACCSFCTTIQYESLTCSSENGGVTLQANLWNNLIWGKTHVLGFTLNECLSTWYKSKRLGGKKVSLAYTALVDSSWGIAWNIHLLSVQVSK